ncbi:MAG: hypothetical protein MUF10_10845 [Thermoanaerobaculaceae bacterium]|jgi:choloylglycine hydrolase|nr:hypothetical protein [Thermoanaerobaculaceae bacterium]
MPDQLSEQTSSNIQGATQRCRVLATVGSLLLTPFLLQPAAVSACSTVKLQHGDALVYGHNLNANGVDVPGLVFVNKRAVFKRGRSWRELIDKNQANPSSLRWIARHGSVTFNTFGKDLPDGGMNEAGLYIWEMGLGNEEVVYPRSESLPKINQMNWMQYVLDNHATLDEALKSVSEVELDGWGWHFFVGDATGDCASIDFVAGKVVIHRGATMPVPGLFNALYDREVEVARYFKGFGGLYEPNLDDREVPRFVKTAVMLRDYPPTEDAVAYGFRILDQLTVRETPDWSVIFDARRGGVHFKTSRNPGVKSFSMKSLDFSNRTPVMVLDMEIQAGGDVTGAFRPFSHAVVRDLIDHLPLPPQFYGSGGLTKAELVDRLTHHCDAAALPEAQLFKGIWRTGATASTRDVSWEVDIRTEGDAVVAEVTSSGGSADRTRVEHLRMIDDRLSFTFRSKATGAVLEATSVLDGATMRMHLRGIEDDLGTMELRRQE